MMLNCWDLLESAKSGNADSLNAIAILATNVATSVIRRKAFSFNDVEDAIQDCLFDVAKDLKSCRAVDQKGFEGWVATVARHSLFNRNTRRMAKKRGNSNPRVRVELEEVQNQEISPIERLVNQEMVAAVKDLLADVTGRPARVFDMYLNGFTDREIAEATGSTILAIRGVIKRVKKNLKEGVAQCESS